MMDDDWTKNLSEDTKLGGKHVPTAAIKNVTVAQADRATTGKKASGEKDGRYHGQYRQVTLRLRPEVVRDIEEWAIKLKVDKAALQRFIVWRGVQALEAGERPETSPRLEMKEY